MRVRRGDGLDYEIWGDARLDVRGCITFARWMIFNAISSFSKGESRFGDEAGVKKWLLTENYRTVCDWAEWDSDWIIDIFIAIEDADEDVRPGLARQCISILSKREIESLD